MYEFKALKAYEVQMHFRFTPNCLPDCVSSRMDRLKEAGAVILHREKVCPLITVLSIS
jgi:hypothetical protein